MRVKKEGLTELAKKVLQLALMPNPAQRGQAFIIALRGNLGAGKTTFTQALARELGISDTVQSPTYVLMKSYPITFGRFTKLIHIDAYRLDKPEEFGALKPDMFLNDREVLAVIEWPERLEGVLPKPNIVVNFSSDGMSEEERYIKIAK